MYIYTYTHIYVYTYIYIYTHFYNTIRFSFWGSSCQIYNLSVIFAMLFQACARLGRPWGSPPGLASHVHHSIAKKQMHGGLQFPFHTFNTRIGAVRACSSWKATKCISFRGLNRLESRLGSFATVTLQISMVSRQRVF